MDLVSRRHVSAAIPDINGRTSLIWAAEGGHAEIVEMLLRRPDAGCNISSNSGRTALSVAARHGHCEVVKLLLEQKDIDPNISGTIMMADA